MPGVCGMPGGMLKLRLDRYVTVAVALPWKRRSALVFKQKFDLILVLRLSEISIREHNLSSTDSAAAATKNKKL